MTESHSTPPESWDSRSKRFRSRQKDEVYEALAVPLDFIAWWRGEHPSQPPLIFSLSPWQDAWTATVSDKTAGASISGFASSPGGAVSVLSDRLTRGELPWKPWHGKKP